MPRYQGRGRSLRFRKTGSGYGPDKQCRVSVARGGRNRPNLQPALVSCPQLIPDIDKECVKRGWPAACLSKEKAARELWQAFPGGTELRYHSGTTRRISGGDAMRGADDRADDGVRGSCSLTMQPDRGSGGVQPSFGRPGTLTNHE